MLQELESDPTPSEPAPAAPAQPTKAASLTGALVQRGRDRAPRIPEVTLVEAIAPAAQAPAAAAEAGSGPEVDPVPLVFAKPVRPRPDAAASPSRWSDALFVAACCAAFFATFLFVLRF